MVYCHDLEQHEEAVREATDALRAELAAARKENELNDRIIKAADDVYHEQKAAIARLREALDAVEWAVLVNKPHTAYYICPCCCRRKTQGHAPDCQLQAALEPPA